MNKPIGKAVFGITTVAFFGIAALVISTLGSEVQSTMKQNALVIDQEKAKAKAELDRQLKRDGIASEFLKNNPEYEPAIQDGIDPLSAYEVRASLNDDYKQPEIDPDKLQRPRLVCAKCLKTILQN